MKSREFKKNYHPTVGRYVFLHRGNGLIVDNVMKPINNLRREGKKAVPPSGGVGLNKQTA